jgi:hypothetical protein
MRSLWELVISTVVLSDLQAEFGMALVRFRSNRARESSR